MVVKQLFILQEVKKSHHTSYQLQREFPFSSLFFTYALLFHYAIIKSDNYASKKRDRFSSYLLKLFPYHKPFKHLPVTSTKKLHQVTTTKRYCEPSGSKSSMLLCCRLGTMIKIYQPHQSKILCSSFSTLACYLPLKGNNLKG